jgi:hypothetical protein
LWAEIPIFFLEAEQGADVGSGKAGEKLRVCKETLFIRPPAVEKSNFLSIKQKDFGDISLQFGHVKAYAGVNRRCLIYYYTLIPKDIKKEIRHKKVINAGWRTGPSYIAGKEKSYKSRPVTLGTALKWVEKYRHILRRSAIKFKDNSVLWLERDAFFRYDRDSKELDSAGCTIACKDGSKVNLLLKIGKKRNP